MVAYVASHVGNSRENQEDNYLVGHSFLSMQEVEVLSRDRSLYQRTFQLENDYCVAVSDGMGGCEQGEMASNLTVQYLSEHSKELFQSLQQVEDEQRYRFFRSLNEAVYALNSNYGSESMGATLCSVISVANHTFCVNVGDSRLYFFYNGKLGQISKDHTMGQRLLDAGVLGVEDLSTFPERKSLYKYIGSSKEVRPDIIEVTDVEAAFLLLCTDGLTDALTLEEIADILASDGLKTSEKASRLIASAMDKTNHSDNITLILLER